MMSWFQHAEHGMYEGETDFQRWVVREIRAQREEARQWRIWQTREWEKLMSNFDDLTAKITETEGKMDAAAAVITQTLTVLADLRTKLIAQLTVPSPETIQKVIDELDAHETALNTAATALGADPSVNPPAAAPAAPPAPPATEAAPAPEVAPTAPATDPSAPAA